MSVTVEKVPSGRFSRYLPGFLMPHVQRLRNTPYGIAFTNHRAKGVWRQFRWDFRRARERIIRRRLNRMPAERRAELCEALAKPGPVSTNGVRLTYTIASRRLGNRDSNLDALLGSLARTARRPESCEVLVKIDDDDDLGHFLAIKKRYDGQLPIRIFATPRLRGYADAHIFAEDLIRHAAPSATTWMVLTDDGVFTRENWDEILYAAIDAYGGDFYIGGELPFEEIISIKGPWPTEPEPIYWYGSNPYHFASIATLNAIASVTADLPGWTRYGSGFCFDTFFSAVAATVWEEYGIDIYLPVERLIERTGDFSFVFSERRNRVRSEALLDLMSAEHRNKRVEIARAIVEAAGLCFVRRVGEPARPKEYAPTRENDR